MKMTDNPEEDWDEPEGEVIDWENPFDYIRSSEVNEITLEFLDNGIKLKKLDENDEEYVLFVWKCIRKDITNPTEITYSTSSKRLIDGLTLEAPMKGKTLDIFKTGSGFQTQYKIKEVK